MTVHPVRLLNLPVTTAGDAQGMVMFPSWMEGVAFTVSEGRALGLTTARMRHPDFTRPFHGMRVTGVAGRIDGGLVDRCTDLRVVLPDEAVFSHRTAALLWGMPLPSVQAERLHVLVPGPIPIRRRGVVGWTTAEWPVASTVHHGVPVTSPSKTWVDLAVMSSARGSQISREWLVAIGDHLVSGRRTRFRREAPLATIDELATAVRQHGPSRGAVGLQWAMERVRMPVDSPPETFLRLGLRAARLPEPAVQPTIMTAVGERHPDLGYLRERVLIEYLGDVHRTDPWTWRQDLTRVQLFEDLGYRVILAGADELTIAGMRGFTERVRRALRVVR